MKSKLAILLCLLSATALAGPARTIQSTSFSVQTPCGPVHDPFAQQGQWFLHLGTGATNVNTREYHDEDNALSIAGVVQNIQFSDSANPLSNIQAFEILVTVINTLPSDYQYGAASNSHSEVQTSAAVTAGGNTMEDVRITAEFALVNAGVIPSGQAPYWPDPLSGGQYYIVAANAHEHAWYCWDPNQTQQQYQPAGAYQVPAWNLTPSTIPPGGTATALMKFQVTGAGIPFNGIDYRHGVLRYSQDTGADVLYNRCESLKISHWLDTIVIDNGVTQTTPPSPYWLEDEVEYIHASNASVFYNDVETEEPHKMHWPQLPDPNGWDVRACPDEPTPQHPDGERKVLADDFLCTATGPITNITFWGSWRDDVFQTQAPWQGIANIHLSIHSDIPDPDGDGPGYSKPALPALKEWDIGWQNIPANWNVSITPEEPSMQGWYDPNLGEVIPDNHTNYFRYDITIPVEDAFVQTNGTIYWLDIHVQTVDPAFMWGWKTSRSPHFNDDAVWADMPVVDTNQWQELYEPPDFEQSLDLAFIIDGPDEEPEPDTDWGDAPDPTYPTLNASVPPGASHTISAGMFLGASVDGEPDGQPNANATGDDMNINGLAGGTPFPPGDEDGVIFTQLVPGLPATITVTASMPGNLDAWIDYNADGVWAAGEKLTGATIALNAGPNIINITVPTGTTPVLSTFARFRYSSLGGLSPTGPASDGEVEDYEVMIDDPMDWGDAPDPLYPTLSSSGGAYHLIVGGGLNPILGNVVDPDLDGQPTPLADGDDIDPQGDDEDGVTWLTPFVPGAVAQAKVVVGGSGGSVDAWIDWNVDGIWANPGERIMGTGALAAGSYTYLILVPTNAVPATNTYARFRISAAGGLTPVGSAQDGEVEDYILDIDAAQEIDWGDAPDTPYPTLRSNNGAHHLAGSPLFLGNIIDGEPDGQPNPNADGDDIDLLYPSAGDDEDGVNLTSLIQPGGYASVDVIASIPGFLDAWVDFNNDGSWNQLGDRIFTSQPLGLGLNSLLFPVPTTAAPGSPAYARFRLSGAPSAYPAGVSYTGLCMDGEVEDYEYYITPLVGGIDFGDAPNTYPTLLPAGARHTITAGIMLGATIDPESDGQPSAASLDDTVGLDDEDGVTFTSKLIAGTNATVDVVAGVLGGNLDAWVDFTKNGDWLDTGEQIFTSQALAPGLNNLNFPVPGLPAQALGTTTARFRISSAGGLGSGGAASDGEVEDYMVDLYQPAPTNLVITNLTFSVSNTVATVEWTAQNSIIYQMQSSTNLTTNVWVNAGTTVTGPLNSQTNNMAAETSKFYRVTAPYAE